MMSEEAKNRLSLELSSQFKKLEIIIYSSRIMIYGKFLLMEKFMYTVSKERI